MSNENHPDGPTQAPASPPAEGYNGRLFLLTVVHLVATAGFSTLSASVGRIPFVIAHILLVPPMALMFCQTALLALWLVYGAGSVWVRLSLSVLATVVLEFTLATAVQDDDFFGMISVAFALAAGTLAVVHWKWASFGKVDAADPQPSREGIRFSVRGLMLLTLVVALLVAGSQWLSRSEISRGPNPFMVGVWAISFVAPNVVAAWATLGTRNGPARWIAVVALAAMLGATFSWIVGEWGRDTFYFITIPALNSLFQLLSLTVVRGCGYRLIPRNPPA